MDEREKLIELLSTKIHPREGVDPAAVAKLMGYERIVTYTLENENGSSLRASGWSLDGLTDAKSWDCKSRPRTTSAPTCRKKRWVKCLKMEEDT